ncbi:acyl-CoA-binding domain-containing protein 6-like isoform X4 [Narcine bancroftii]|uniref:acyl-CoA-binding domain-containing protein 6-like isoform X4 n=1 Tax=Narcine bancroftii TaxID=1343680 RepID=UPI0038311EEC
MAEARRGKEGSEKRQSQARRPCGSGGSELRAEFKRAAEHVPELAPTASREQMLYLYSRFKQAKFGKCNIPKPGFFDFEGRQKWEAWKEMGDMTAQQAMQEYVAAVKELDPEWNPEDVVKESDQKVLFGGPVVSCLYQEEIIREEDKTIFDHCRENNIDHILKALVSQNVDVNLKDEEGRALLHWACDRGHKELVRILLQQKAEINDQVWNYSSQQSIMLDAEGTQIFKSALISAISSTRNREKGKTRLENIQEEKNWLMAKVHNSRCWRVANLRKAKDYEGQTALHYASACEFADIVELLLNSGADPSIQDGEGCLPEQVTDAKHISQMLRQHAATKG